MLGTLLLCAASTLASASADTSPDGVWEGEFDSLFEPSGVTQLRDGSLLIVEDEARRALRLVALAGERGRPRLLDERTVSPGGGLLARFDIGALDDLEGVARDRSGRVYVVGSHEDLTKKRRSDRQKLLRFSVEDGATADVTVTRDLGRDLVAAYPALHEAIFEGKKKRREALSIEALAFDRTRGELLVGLRTPVLDDDAVIARLLNPGPYVAGDAPAAFAERLLTVDLDKGGLRAMSYDDASDRLLVISRRESGGGGSFKLWQVATDGEGKPERLRLPKGTESLHDVEGLTTVHRGPATPSDVLFVRDDGNPSKGRGAEWFVLSREALDMQTQER